MRSFLENTLRERDVLLPYDVSYSSAGLLATGRVYHWQELSLELEVNSFRAALAWRKSGRLELTSKNNKKEKKQSRFLMK